MTLNVCVIQSPVVSLLGWTSSVYCTCYLCHWFHHLGYQSWLQPIFCWDRFCFLLLLLLSTPLLVLSSRKGQCQTSIGFVLSCALLKGSSQIHISYSIGSDDPFLPPYHRSNIKLVQLCVVHGASCLAAATDVCRRR